MAVPFKELAQSPTENYGRDGLRAVRMFLVGWSDRDEFVTEILGDGATFGGTGQIEYPDKPGVRPHNVRIVPFTDDVTPQALTDLQTDLNTYGSGTGMAKVTVDYSAMGEGLPDPWDVDPQEFTYLTYQVHGAAEAVLAKTQALYWWNSPGEPEAVTEDDLYRVIRVPVVEHHVTWHYVLRPNAAAIRAVVGKINASAWQGTDAETMLFDTYSIGTEYVILEDGSQIQPVYQVTYVFRERRVNTPLGVRGWNYFYRTLPKADEGWDRLQNSGGDPTYMTASNAALDALFQY